VAFGVETERLPHVADRELGEVSYSRSSSRTVLRSFRLAPSDQQGWASSWNARRAAVSRLRVSR